MKERVGEQLLVGRKFTVDRIWVTNRDGKEVPRERVTHPGAVVLLPLLGDDRIVFIRNRRFTLGKELLELPAGTVELGEEKIVCAKRELEEETGFTARELTPLLEFYASPGITDEKMYSFVARGLTSVGQRLEETEQISTVVLTFAEAEELVRARAIEDGKTLVTLLYFLRFERR